MLARTGVDPVTEPFTGRVDAAVTVDRAKARLGAALAMLSARQRDALLLVTWAGLTYDQAASPRAPQRGPGPGPGPAGRLRDASGGSRARPRSKPGRVDHGQGRGRRLIRGQRGVPVRAAGRAGHRGAVDQGRLGRVLLSGERARDPPARHASHRSPAAEPGGPVPPWVAGRASATPNLASLPSDPAALESVILAGNTPGKPWYSSSRDAAIFSAIATLLQGQVLGWQALLQSAVVQHPGQIP